MLNRIDNVLKTIKKNHAFYISNPSDIFYLTGFSGTFARIIAKGEKAYFITDHRYEKVVENAGIEKKFIVIITKKHAKDTRLLLSTSKKVYMSNKTPLEEYFSIKDAMGKKVEFSSLISDLRMIKDDNEIKRIKEAVKIIEAGIKYLITILKEGVSEKDLEIELEYFVKKHGAESMSFPPIIAFGHNSNSPHHITSMKKLKKGDLILMDAGVKYLGYCSDLTRVAGFGIIKSRLKEVVKSYNLVQEAKKISLDLYRIGIFINKAEQKAREFFNKYGLELFFTHSLGHSLGIDIHELPACNLKENNRFKKGMVLTCEPGIYLRNYGIRIEDDYLITSTRPEKLGKMNDDFIVI